MTGAWAAITGAVLAAGAWQTAPKSVSLDDSIRITAPRQSQDVAHGITKFSDRVSVEFGPTKITADEVVADQVHHQAKASGNVVLTDPEGTVQATDILLNWGEGTRRATAQNVYIEVAGARLRAKSAVLTDKLWSFNDIEGTTCRRNTPLYTIRAPLFEVVPGKSGRLVHPRLSLFGKQIVTLPTQRFNLDPRVQGIHPPNIAYRKDQGLGVAWNGQFLIDSQTAGGFDLGAFRGGYPNIGLGISRSFVPSEKSTALIVPRDDLGDRFNLGYFDSIELNSPKAGFSQLSNPRSTLSLTSQFNRSANIGPPDLSYSKPVDLAYEAGGRQGSFGTLEQARIQTIRTQNTPIVTRLSLGGTAISDVLPLAKRVGALGSLDVQGYLGGREHAWTRASGGIVYEPLKELRLGAAAFIGKEFGTADFPADDLYAKTGYALRADLNLGGLRARYMVKFDREHKWYDREYSVNQAIGCLEAFVLYRKFPQTYLVGVKIRLDQFVDLLQKRKFERTKLTTKTVISGPR